MFAPMSVPLFHIICMSRSVYIKLLNSDDWHENSVTTERVNLVKTKRKEFLSNNQRSRVIDFFFHIK